MRKHSKAEIITKLRRASALANRGVGQAAICKELGISVMTLHRWRKLGSISPQNERSFDNPMSLMARENKDLRNIAVNLLLEITELATEGRKIDHVTRARALSA